ncbi:hypothetical protein JCM1393_18900 [Clostridium carnis]
MIKIEKASLLKDAPDYEDYTKNEVKLTTEEMIELGMISKGGCCKTKGAGGCCKKRK